MGQIGASMFYGTLLEPHIIHVVSYCESFKRATAKEIIESVKIARRAVNVALRGAFEPLSDRWIMDEKERIKNDALTDNRSNKIIGRRQR